MAKERVKPRQKCAAVVKAKKTIRRLKSMFTRRFENRRNVLDAIPNNNIDKAQTGVYKCKGEKLSDVDNLLQDETFSLTRLKNAEDYGKVALFRQFVNDINEPLSKQDVAGDALGLVDSLKEPGHIREIKRLSSLLNKTFTHSWHSSICSERDNSMYNDKLNDAFTQTGDSSKFTETDNDITDLTDNHNEAFEQTPSLLETINSLTSLTNKLNEAFIDRRNASVLNMAVLYTSLCETEITLASDNSNDIITDSIIRMANQCQTLNENRTEVIVTDSTDMFNECGVFNESRDWNESSENDAGDDDEVDELERNICDDDLEAFADDFRCFFDTHDTKDTDDAIDSFMNSLVRH